MLPDEFEGIVSFDRDASRGVLEEEIRQLGIPENEITHRATSMMENKLYLQMKEATADQRHFVLETITISGILIANAIRLSELN
jgi:hypothetical protein